MDEIHFYCAICGENLCTQARNAGGFCHCPKCQRVIPVPGYPARPNGTAAYGPVFSPLILEISLKFLCQNCRVKLRVDVRYRGQPLNCPRCSFQTTVPDWSFAASSAESNQCVGIKTPVVVLSAEEREFLSAPLENGSGARLSSGAR